jgi:ABC-type glutathione transport system ATPase component
VSAVVIDKVTKVFNPGRPDQVVALSEVDLTVGDGEFVSLIGPSGCGKSTLLRLIGDLIAPSAGTVTIAGQAAGTARKQQAYGIAFQQSGLFEWRTVLRNVELPLELRGLSRAERQARAQEMLDLVNEVNKLIWPSTGGIGLVDDAAWKQTVDISLHTKNQTGDTVLKKEPEGTAFTNEYVSQALTQAKAAGVDVTGASFHPETVTLEAGGA